MLNRRFVGRWLFRLIFFAPYVISEVIAGVVWRLILQPDGLADGALSAVGLDRCTTRGWPTRIPSCGRCS